LNRRPYLALITLAALALPSIVSAQPKEAQKLYKWVDDKGVVHYGDTIPPEYATRDRSVLNDRGVRVGFEEGEITEQEKAEIARKEAEVEAARAAKLEEARRDRSLLETYSSVSDIEDLRDRRLELLESQIKVTEVYLGNLRERLVGLQEEASSYKPYTTREDAPQIPENLALDISRTADSINGYERTLAQTREDQEALRAAFEKDIRRFKELKGG
jgi:uncharacterized protein DUF4124